MWLGVVVGINDGQTNGILSYQLSTFRTFITITMTSVFRPYTIHYGYGYGTTCLSAIRNTKTQHNTTYALAHTRLVF